MKRQLIYVEDHQLPATTHHRDPEHSIDLDRIDHWNIFEKSHEMVRHVHMVKMAITYGWRTS